MEYFATVKLSIERFPMSFYESIKIPLADAKKLNDSKSWDVAKELLGDKFNDKIRSIQIDTPLKNDLTYIVVLKLNKAPFSGILGGYEFHKVK